jgi:MinD superfamily P-loop ATPase
MRIAVTGGKGGTGKSTVATALAVELARQARVLLVDADADCPNDHLLLSIERKKILTVTQRLPMWDLTKCTACAACGSVCPNNAVIAVKNYKPFFVPAQCHGCGACVQVCPSHAIGWGAKEIGTIYEGHHEHVTLLSGELKIQEPASERIVHELQRMIAERQQSYDTIIIDTAAGTHCDVVAALQGAHYVLAVTEPTPLGAHDLGLILQLVRLLGLRTGIVINRSDIGDSAAIEHTAQQYETDIICRIPYAEEIVRSYATGKPIQHTEIEKLAIMIANMPAAVFKDRPNMI